MISKTSVAVVAGQSVTTISDVQTIPNWKLQTGTNIGGNPPSKFAFTLGADQWLPNAVLLSVTGKPGQFTDWLAGIALPLPAANTGNVRMYAAFTVDEGSLTTAQAIEMDTKITDENGVTYNGSMQFDYSQSATQMQVQIDKAGGGWVSAGFPMLPKFAPYVLHTVVVNYQFNATTKTYSVLNVTIDGVLFDVAADLQGLPGKNVGWAKSEILPQLQQDVNKLGLSWQEMIYSMNYDVW